MTKLRGNFYFLRAFCSSLNITLGFMTIMPMPREKWTDERLDDLNGKVDKGFEETKAEFKDVRREMREGFARVDGEFKDVRREMQEGFARVDGEFKDLRREMNERFDQVDASFQGLYRVLTGGAFAIIATLIGGQVFG